MSPDPELAVRQWARQLIDLGGRNRMLYYRDLARGTLRLDGIAGPALESLLNDAEIRFDSLGVTDPDDARRRLKTIRDKSRENLEEDGIRTLYLAIGIATWDSTRRSDPAAPVVLWPLEIHLDRGQPVLRGVGEEEVNPALQFVMETDFGITGNFEPRDHVASAEALLDLLEIIRATYEDVPGFHIDPAPAIVGNFSYEKLPMVADLESDPHALLSHPIVAALAGDSGAQERLLSDAPPGPEAAAAARDVDRYLVLDADPTQRQVLSRIAAGESLVVEGPPGTGKSQTIANLIAVAAAAGRSVLFVAEKRAAIDAVLSRLEAVDLEDLTLDLHGAIISRRRLAERLGEAVELAERRTPNAVVAEADGGERQRLARRLNDLTRLLHARNGDVGRSLYELIESVSRVDGDLVMPRRLGTLSTEERAELLRLVREWEARRPVKGSPWSEARIHSVEDAEAAVAAVEEASARVREVIGVLDRIGIDKQNASAASVLAACRGAKSGRDAVGSFRRSVWSIDATDLLAGLRERGFAGFAAAREALSEHLSASEPFSDEQAVLEAIAIAQQAILRLGQTPTASIVDLLAEGEDEATKLVRSLRTIEAVIGRELADTEMSDLSTLLDRLGATSSVALDAPVLHQVVEELTRFGLGELVSALSESSPSLDAQGLVESVARSVDAAALNALLADQRSIREMSARSLQSTANEFRAVDRSWQDTAPTRVRSAVSKHFAEVVQDHPRQRQAVLAEAAKSRRHRSLREVVGSAPAVLAAARPCWTMSPLMVSQLLPAVSGLFDIVVFDEASQVLPADAIPALYRGKQAVIAGDRRQLPPTMFFMSGHGEGEAVSEEDLGLTADFDSILDVLFGLMPSGSLSWHYRSRDDRLISFSNSEFYGESLVTFPGTSVASAIEHYLVESPAPADRTASNPAEVERVVDLVMAHAAERRDQSLGVVAMGLGHADALGAAVEARLRDETSNSVLAFFSDQRSERFFVKNLERVQGDERDVVILSLGYAAGPDGSLRHNFGPINQQGGDRRLNVAVTRARRRMVVVSSFRSRDLDLSRSRADGVRVLKEYLAYAEGGGGSSGVADPGEVSNLTRTIAHHLGHAGLKVLVNYGTTDARVDVAVVDPDDSSRLRWAILLDGPFYASLPSPTDRDRLRLEVLESMGWKVIPTRAISWWRSPVEEAERIVEAIRSG